MATGHPGLGGGGIRGAGTMGGGRSRGGGVSMGADYGSATASAREYEANKRGGDKRSSIPASKTEFYLGDDSPAPSGMIGQNRPTIQAIEDSGSLIDMDPRLSTAIKIGADAQDFMALPISSIVGPSQKYDQSLLSDAIAGRTGPARQAIEDWGSTELANEIKSRLDPNMHRGYYSPLLSDPNRMHVLMPGGHPDDQYAFKSQGVGGFVPFMESSASETADIMQREQLVKFSPEGEEYFSHGPWTDVRYDVPHIGSAKYGVEEQTINPGDLYMMPQGLQGASLGDEDELVSDPLDIWAHELGHTLVAPSNLSPSIDQLMHKDTSAERTSLIEKLPELDQMMYNKFNKTEELVQRYEDSLYAISPQMRKNAKDFLQSAYDESKDQLEWSNQMLSVIEEARKEQLVAMSELMDKIRSGEMSSLSDEVGQAVTNIQNLNKQLAEDKDWANAHKKIARQFLGVHKFLPTLHSNQINLLSLMKQIETLGPESLE